jgi:hypothetical protein
MADSLDSRSTGAHDADPDDPTLRRPDDLVDPDAPSATPAAVADDADGSSERVVVERPGPDDGAERAADRPVADSSVEGIDTVPTAPPPLQQHGDGAPIDHGATERRDEAGGTVAPGAGVVAARRDDGLRDDTLRDDERVRRDDDLAVRRSVLRVPTFSPLAPLFGWLVAWGAIATATAILERVGVPTGFNLGIADGGPGDDGFWAGLWAVCVSGGAFVLGGYAAARIARANGTKHAALTWLVAMVATTADAVVEAIRDGTEGVIRLIVGVPFWAETGMVEEAETILALAVFAAASLLGALVGGALGQAANRMDRTDDAVVVRPSERDGEAVHTSPV